MNGRYTFYRYVYFINITTIIKLSAMNKYHYHHSPLYLYCHKSHLVLLFSNLSKINLT